MTALFSSIRAGSSPRVRGTPDATETTPGLSRFIPAGAGNAPCTAPCSNSSPVHPRGCGERMTVRHPGTGEYGSSPRVRGTRRPEAIPSDPNRFIPAGAGNARTTDDTPRRRSVHPRGCGERPAPNVSRGHRAGSSPRVRGTHRPQRPSEGSERFIPAGAGNAQAHGRQDCNQAVHPRGCGER